MAHPRHAGGLRGARGRARLLGGHLHRVRVGVRLRLRLRLRLTPNPITNPNNPNPNPTQVAIFTVCAFLCLGTLMLRRYKLGFELGGPEWHKKATAALFVVLWFVYIALSAA